MGAKFRSTVAPPPTRRREKHQSTGAPPLALRRHVLGVVWVATAAVIVLLGRPKLVIIPEGRLQLDATPTFRPAINRLFPVDSERRHGPRFVFFMGLEGTGHHLLKHLYSVSPAAEVFKSLNLDVQLRTLERLFLRRLLLSHCSTIPLETGSCKPEETAESCLIRRVLSLLSHIESTLIAHNFGHAVIPLIMASYPADVRACRAIRYPDLDMVYEVCRLANVECQHAYVHRDPYAVVDSTLWKRGFNKGVAESLQLYTSMLGVIYTHMSTYSHNLIGCFELLPTQSANETGTDPSGILSSFFAWPSSDTSSFAATLKSIFKPPVPTRKNDEIIPPEFHVYLKSMQEAHDAVLQRCAPIPAQLTPSIVATAYDGSKGATFVFFMGLEGSGHRLVGTKLRESYSGSFVNEFGLREMIRHLQDSLYSNAGLFYIHCNLTEHKSEISLADGRFEATSVTTSASAKAIENLAPDETFERVVELFKKIKDQIGNNAAVNIPLNADGYISNLASYPQDHDSCRLAKYPNIDLLYAACYQAAVECQHIYLSPFAADLVASTIQAGDQTNSTPLRTPRYLFKTLLDVMYAQIALHPNRAMSCLDVPSLSSSDRRDTSWVQELDEHFGLSVDRSRMIDTGRNKLVPRWDLMQNGVDVSLQLLGKSLARTREICRQVLKSPN